MDARETKHDKTSNAGKNERVTKKEWITIGRKRGGKRVSFIETLTDEKCHTRRGRQAFADLSPMEITPEAIYDANSRDVKIDRTVEGIVHSITDALSTLSQSDILLAYSQITTFVCDNTVSAFKDRYTEILSNEDDQKIVMQLTGCIDKANQVIPSIMRSSHTMNELVYSMGKRKNDSITNIKQFLVTCGINEIPLFTPDFRKKNDMDVTSGAPTVAPEVAPEVAPKKSYRDAIDSSAADYGVAIERKRTPPPIMQKMIADTGIVSIIIPTVTRAAECRTFAMYHYRQYDIFIIRIGGIVFNAGPADFINLKNSNIKSVHAKRCLNDAPCSHDNCNYYHDPCATHKNRGNRRNFAISYVHQMLNNIKGDVDLIENTAIRDIDFLRDLIHLGGSIIAKAAQIQALYFKN